MSGDFSWMSEN